MRKFFLIPVVALCATGARADDMLDALAKQRAHTPPATAIDLACGEHETSHLHVVVDANQQVISLNVTLLNPTVLRSQQYTLNAHLSTTADRTYVWTGDWFKNPAIHMVGTLNMTGSMFYREVQLNNANGEVKHFDWPTCRVVSSAPTSPSPQGGFAASAEPEMSPPPAPSAAEQLRKEWEVEREKKAAEEELRKKAMEEEQQRPAQEDFKRKAEEELRRQEDQRRADRLRALVEEARKRGPDYAAQSGTSWELRETRDEMTDGPVYEVSSHQGNNLVSVGVQGKCIGGRMMIAATFLDADGSGRHPTVSPTVQWRVNDLPFGVMTLETTNFSNQFVIMGGPLQRENGKEPAITDENFLEMWALRVRFETSGGEIVVKIPFFDGSVRKFIDSCRGS
jgi:hypothetical protein